MLRKSFALTASVSAALEIEGTFSPATKRHIRQIHRPRKEARSALQRRQEVGRSDFSLVFHFRVLRASCWLSHLELLKIAFTPATTFRSSGSNWSKSRFASRSNERRG